MSGENKDCDAMHLAAHATVMADILSDEPDSERIRVVAWVDGKTVAIAADQSTHWGRSLYVGLKGAHRAAIDVAEAAEAEKAALARLAAADARGDTGIVGSTLINTRKVGDER